MYTKICPQCGKEFEALLKRKKYCSDLCRQRACRDRKEDAPRQNQLREQALKDAQNRLEQSRKDFQRRLEAGDLTARWLDLKRRAPYSYEYWVVFAEYDSVFGGDLITTINGIRTDHPHFADGVLVSIDELGVIRSDTQSRLFKEDTTNE